MLRYRRGMRFGSRSHDTDTDKLDRTVTSERDRLVRTLRELADRIEGAPFNRITESVAWLTSAVEPLTQMVDRALGGHRGK
jgi:hypothetical protein